MKTGMIKSGPALAKAEEVAKKYIQCHNKTEAWKSVYDKNNTHNRNAAKVKAYEYFKRSYTKEFVKKYQERAMKQHDITIEKLLVELEEARQLAILGADNARPSATAAVAATMGKAKICGLDKQIVDHVSSDGSMSPTKELEGEELRKELDRRGLKGLIDAINE